MPAPHPFRGLLSASRIQSWTRRRHPCRPASPTSSCVCQTTATGSKLYRHAESGHTPNGL